MYMQNESILSEIDLYDGAIENATWQTFGADSLTGDRILRVRRNALPLTNGMVIRRMLIFVLLTYNFMEIIII